MKVSEKLCPFENMVSRSSLTQGGKEKNKIFYLLLWVGCLIGNLAVVPYVYYLGFFPENVSLVKVILSGMIQNALLFGLACFLSYKLLPKTDLHPFSVKNP